MKLRYSIKQAGKAIKQTKYIDSTSCTKIDKAKKSKEKKKQDQFLERIEKMGLLIAGNFVVKKDKAVVLTIPKAKLKELQAKAKAEHKSYYMSAEEDLRKFLKRFRRMAQKKGITFKYLAITSQRSKNGKRTRLHYHLVVNSEAVPFLKESWSEWVGGPENSTRPIVRDKTLYRDPSRGSGEYALARYMLSQVTHYKNKSDYIASKNLDRVKVVEKGELTDSSLLGRPPGAEIIHTAGGGMNPTQSITFIQSS